MTNMIQAPLLSVIITACTMDRFADICSLLDSIKSQTYHDIEVMFIAEGYEELYQKVKAYEEKLDLKEFKAIYKKEKLGLGGARNLGSKMVKGEIIAFVDDDVVLFSDWAEEMVKSYQDQMVIGVTGAAFPLWRDKKLDWLPEEFYWLISCTAYTQWNSVVEARSLWGGNMSFRKEVFEKTGSFLPTLGYHAPIAEDLEFSLRVKKITGKKLIYNPAVKVRHSVYAYRINLKYVAARAHHIGVSRHLLRTTYLKNTATFDLEKKVMSGIVNILLSTPRLLIINPGVAWNKLLITCTIILYAGIGYVFPGKNSQAIHEIEKASIA